MQAKTARGPRPVGETPGRKPSAPVGRGFSVAAGPSRSSVTKAGHAVVQEKRATGGGATARARLTPAALQTQVIQRTMDFPAGFPGSGLTPDVTDAAHGKWHIHAYSDSADEKKARAFTRFHVKFIFNVPATAAAPAKEDYQYVGFREVGGAPVVQNSTPGTSAAKVAFATQKAKDFLGTCAKVTAVELAKKIKAYDDQKAAQAAQAAAAAAAVAAHQAVRDAAAAVAGGGLGNQDDAATRAYRLGRRMAWMALPSATRGDFDVWLAANP